MTIAEYEALTGLKVDDEARFKALVRRSESRLSSLLGYSLSSKKTWTEKGKVRYDGLVPFPSLPVGEEVLSKLAPPDSQTGDIKLFRFDELNKHIRINPAREVYQAKVVLPINEDEFITIYDLKNGLPYLNAADLVVAITRYETWFTWTWWNSLLWGHKSSLQIAVDADYVDVCNINEFPDLAYLLADMVTYYGDDNFSLMHYTSESVDSHSWSRGVRGATPEDMSPEGLPSGKRIIEKYAGPGAFRNLVR